MDKIGKLVRAPTLHGCQGRSTPHGGGRLGKRPTSGRQVKLPLGSGSLGLQIHRPSRLGRLDRLRRLHLGAGHPPELYDMASDPAEDSNVFGENPDKVAELHAGLIELLEREGAPEGRIEIARRLPNLDAEGDQTDDRSGY